LLVTVEGGLDSRPKVDGRGKETTLIVQRFVRTWPRETCGGLQHVTLEDTTWALLELKGKTITVTVNDKAPYLELNSKKASAYGFGGCNRFFGSYETSGQSLTFGAMGATRMACPEGMDQEQTLMTVLGSTTRYEIHGSKLMLFADKELVARFEARAPAE
jgi:heat shock protein HslJ